MDNLVPSLLVSFLLTASLIFANERFGILSSDRFPTAAAKWFAYLWFWGFVSGVTVLVIQSSTASAQVDTANIPFWSLFMLHVLLMVFLIGWWASVGRPSITEYMNLSTRGFAQNAAIGVAVGIGGWILTIAIALIVGSILMGMGLMPEDAEPSPMIPWMAALPIWKKALIVFSAMTVEEFFFRGWLQKRVGLILSTILFAIAHAGYGQPFLLVGVTIVSLVIGYTFYRTRNLWPCIIAHGVFDAIQLLVIVPIVLQVTGKS
ncbi:MAG: lysostaphin resistance A-like protein [Thermoanaerobaculia bacterium]